MESYGKYFEDVDFCLRMARAGWVVTYHGAASCCHLERRPSRKPLLGRCLAALPPTTSAGSAAGGCVRPPACPETPVQRASEGSPSSALACIRAGVIVWHALKGRGEVFVQLAHPATPCQGVPPERLSAAQTRRSRAPAPRPSAPQHRRQADVAQDNLHAFGGRLAADPFIAARSTKWPPSKSGMGRKLITARLALKR